MRAVVQRVREATVRCAALEDDQSGTVPAPRIRRIGLGMVVLVGVTHADERDHAHRLADKLWTLRIFDDADGVPNLGCDDVAGDVMVVSQFTLYADTRKGRRPSYRDAAAPTHARPLVDEVAQRFRQLGATVATGCFGQHMDVSLFNDGPWTVTIDV